MTQKQFDRIVGKTMRSAVHEQIENLKRRLDMLTAVSRGTAEFVEVNRRGYTIKKVRVKPTTYYRIRSAA